MKTIISQKLMSLGVKPNLKGFTYLVSAIEMILKKGCRHMGITKVIYPKLQKTYNTTWHAIERAIRYAVDGSTTYRLLTNGAFMYTAANDIMNELSTQESSNYE